MDVAAGSPFLTRLYETPIPKDLPFHLFFGWGEPAITARVPAGDGTIALPSQLDPRVQTAATRMMGYGDTHVGILSDAEALKELSRVLDATTAAREVVRRPAAFSQVWWQEWGLTAMLVFLVLALFVGLPLARRVGQSSARRSSASP